MYKLASINKPEEWKLYAEMVETTDWASFTLHPDWLYGYELVPFFIKKVGFFIYNNNHKKIGGVSGIKYWLGKWKIVYPSDPVYIHDVSEVDKIQIWQLILKQSKAKTHVSSYLDLEDIGLTKGIFPKGIYPNPGIGYINTSFSEFDSFLQGLKPTTRRDIRASYRKELKMIEVIRPEDLKNIYNEFKGNAIRNGYRIKPFWMYKRSWVKQLKSRSSRFLYVTHDDSIKGAIWAFKSGRAYNYIMGASRREKKDLLVGHRIQAEMFKRSIQEGFSYYNISVGGPKGVEQFKDDFGREHLHKTNKYIFNG